MRERERVLHQERKEKLAMNSIQLSMPSNACLMLLLCLPMEKVWMCGRVMMMIRLLSRHSTSTTNTFVP